MSRDPTRDWVEDTLLWFRRQPGAYDERLAHADPIINVVGGGSAREAKRKLQEILREHAGMPDGDVMAYFYTSGYRTDGANLDERLKSYAKRHHVVPRTALRRSDRGARAIAQLVREDMRYDRPWAYLIAAQDGGLLHVFMRVTVDPGNDLVPPAIQINGERLGDTELKLIPRDDDARDTYRVEIPPIQLNTNVDASEPLAKVAMAWFPGVAPTWDLAAAIADQRVHIHLSLAPLPTAELTVEWWNDKAASTRDQPLAEGLWV